MYQYMYRYQFPAETFLKNKITKYFEIPTSRKTTQSKQSKKKKKEKKNLLIVMKEGKASSGP